jgi:hypothetical protein
MHQPISYHDVFPWPYIRHSKLSWQWLQELAECPFRVLDFPEQYLPFGPPPLTPTLATLVALDSVLELAEKRFIPPIDRQPAEVVEQRFGLPEGTLKP